MTSQSNFFGELLEKNNVTVHYGPTQKVYSIKNILFLRNLIRANKYDIIHTHLFSPQLFMPLALKLTSKKVPMFTTEHSTHNRRRENKIFYFLDYWMYRQYNKIIAITPETKKNLNNYLPYTKNKTDVILNGIELDKYTDSTPIPKEHLSSEIGKDEKLIVMVAAMRAQKDHETLIRASKFLPNNYHILFVGDGERLTEVQAYAKKNGSEKITFLGNRLDIPSILKACDTFVLSSKWEGFGLVVVEAAAAGLPIVASDVEGLNNVVKSIGGQVFEPYNERQLAQKILEVNEKSKKKLNKDLEIYSIDNTVEQYLDLYNSEKDKW